MIWLFVCIVSVDPVLVYSQRQQFSPDGAQCHGQAVEAQRVLAIFLSRQKRETPILQT